MVVVLCRLTSQSIGGVANVPRAETGLNLREPVVLYVDVLYVSGKLVTVVSCLRNSMFCLRLTGAPWGGCLGCFVGVHALGWCLLV